MQETFKIHEEKMGKTIAVFQEDLDTVRAGRANPNVLDKITVDYYGSATSIAQIGNISVPEPRMLLIQPWDASMLKEVEKAIQKSDLGINPTNDGKVIRIAFPQPTEERRRELVKAVHKKSEDAKVAIRSIRRDAMDHFKKMKKANEITEDDLKDMEEQMQELTDDRIKLVDEITKKKEKEIIEV